MGVCIMGVVNAFPTEPDTPLPPPDHAMEALYQATLQKTKSLRAMGYTVVEMWECEWKSKVSASPEIQAFLSSLDMVLPLNPLDAIFWRRTGAASLCYKAAEPKGKKYVTWTSRPNTLG